MSASSRQPSTSSAISAQDAPRTHPTPRVTQRGTSRKSAPSPCRLRKPIAMRGFVVVFCSLPLLDPPLARSKNFFGGNPP